MCRVQKLFFQLVIVVRTLWEIVETVSRDGARRFPGFCRGAGFLVRRVEFYNIVQVMYVAFVPVGQYGIGVFKAGFAGCGDGAASGFLYNVHG